MRSTLLNMVAVLFCITLISSAGVGLVNMITVDPIAEAKAKADAKARQDLIADIRAKMPDAVLRTTLIVGFPTRAKRNLRGCAIL